MLLSCRDSKSKEPLSFWVWIVLYIRTGKSRKLDPAGAGEHEAAILILLTMPNALNSGHQLKISYGILTTIL